MAKNLGWQRHSRCYVTGARRQESAAAEWSWIRPWHWVYYGRSPTKWFRLIINILNRSRDLAWWRGGTTDVTNALAHAIFSPTVWPSSRSNFDPGPSPSDSTKKNLSDQDLWFWSAVFLWDEVLKGLKKVWFHWQNPEKIPNKDSWIRCPVEWQVPDAKITHHGSYMIQITKTAHHDISLMWIFPHMKILRHENLLVQNLVKDFPQTAVMLVEFWKNQPIYSDKN